MFSTAGHTDLVYYVYGVGKLIHKNTHCQSVLSALLLLGVSCLAGFVCEVLNNYEGTSELRYTIFQYCSKMEHSTLGLLHIFLTNDFICTHVPSIKLSRYKPFPRH